MSPDTLPEVVEATATRFSIPGVAVGVWADGREVYACHGVTSIDNPLPVDPDTLYLLGSITKTYTATTLLRLVADGRVELEAPVRRYLPTVALRASTLGDAVGIGWFLREVDGVATVGHGGSANGQVVRWVLQAYLGVTDRDLEPLAYDPARARELVGSYEIGPMTVTIGTDGSRLRLEVRIRPEIRAAADKELPPDIEPSELGLLPGDGDEYVITSGALAGQRGFFTRDRSGAVVGVDLAGRFAKRVSTPSQQRSRSGTGDQEDGP